MSQRERSSLTAALAKRPLGKAQELASAAAAESLVLGQPADTPPVAPVSQPMGQPGILPTIQPTVLPQSLLKRKEKQRPRIAWTFKIPPELHQELSEVAEHNDLPMSEIVIEAISLHLKNFPHPPRL